MAERLFMIALSPTMTEGVLARWLVKEGEAFQADAVLCEVETDKATMDYPAPKAGVLLKTVLQAGGKAAVGDTIAVFGKAGEDPAPLLPGAGAAAGASVGSAASAPRAAAPAAAPQPAAPPGGAAASASTPTARPAPAAPPSTVSNAPGFPPSSPLARVLARDAGLDLREIAGSGPGGRVVKRDVEAFAAARAAGPAARAGSGAPSSAAGFPVQGSGAAPGAADRVIPVSGKRAVIARRLSESFFGAPHFYLRKRVLADRLAAARTALNKGRELPVSYNALLAKLAAEALKRHPAVNASWRGDSILERASVDIGLAVALPDGLITPVVRDCGNKGASRIEEEFAALIAKAKAKGLAPEEYEGASFTITNIGGFGIDDFTAIINPPGSAILAVGALRKEAVVDEEGDEVRVRRVMRLTLGCDHRVIDGAVGAAFLRDLAAFIEEPLGALL